MITSYDLQTPTLLFPALSLLILAYTNRFLGITTVIRKLHEDLSKDIERSSFYMGQINSLRIRVQMIINAQRFGIFSLMLCVISMFSILINKNTSIVFFFLALTSLFISLIFIGKELNVSQNAMQYIIDDCKEVSAKNTNTD
jgi:Protein of unknown function (DUF2721)